MELGAIHYRDLAFEVFQSDTPSLIIKTLLPVIRAPITNSTVMCQKCQQQHLLATNLVTFSAPISNSNLTAVITGAEKFTRLQEITATIFTTY